MISSVNDYDLVKIYSSYMSMTEKRVNCANCKLDRRHEQLKKVQSCESPGQVKIFPVELDYCNIDYYQCIGAFAMPEFNYIWTLYKSFKDNSSNPLGGSIIDMPNKLYEVFNLLDNLEIERQTKQQEADGKRNKHRTHGRGKTGGTSII